MTNEKRQRQIKNRKKKEKQRITNGYGRNDNRRWTKNKTDEKMMQQKKKW